MTKAPAKHQALSKPALKEPLFHWPDERRSGILLHPTALPGTTGIGTMGAHARAFIDLLSNCGCTLWQTCPLGPTGFGDSPYQCLSAFAGNPYLIDLEELVSIGILKKEELKPLQTAPDSRVEYGHLWENLLPLLHSVAQRSPAHAEDLANFYGSFSEFQEEHKDWLEPYALFRALKTHFQHKAWTRWPAKWRSYERAIKENLPDDVTKAVETEKWLQYIFFGQWTRLRSYAASKGISIIGDIPIFVALDGADVWQHPQFFRLDSKLQPKVVAGVPPDYFSDTGQLWGNPLYDWESIRADQYRWWLRRFRLNYTLFDWVRIDHFRGFEAAYCIPANAEDAREGKWEKGPGLDFFQAIQKEIPDGHIILEDLGIITPEVNALRAQTGLPGMSVLHFAFDSPDNAYLPHNLSKKTILYPGSHDNDTTVSWYQTQPEKIQDYVRRYFRVSGDEIAWDLIRAGYQSVADSFIIPYQDLLGLGSEARFNTPGTAQGNWSWRTHPDTFGHIDTHCADYLRELSYLYHRNQPDQ